MKLKSIIIWATILCLAGIGYAVAGYEYEDGTLTVNGGRGRQER